MENPAGGTTNNNKGRWGSKQKIPPQVLSSSAQHHTHASSRLCTPTRPSRCSGVTGDCGERVLLQPQVLRGHERACSTRMSQQETGLTFDVLILSRIQQSSSESKRTDVAVIHHGAGTGDKIWIRSQLVRPFGFVLVSRPSNVKV